MNNILLLLLLMAGSAALGQDDKKSKGTGWTYNEPAFVEPKAADADMMKKLPKQAKIWVKDMALVPGGTFVARSRQQAEDSLMGQAHVDMTVSVASFYISKYEVTNREWQEFWLAKKAELGEAEALKFMPDTSVWRKYYPYAFNEPIQNHYAFHAAYAEYPVLGISWEQANAYCLWRSEQLNKVLKAQGLPALPNFRLPTEMEWEYAAGGNIGYDAPKMTPRVQSRHPWNGQGLISLDKKYKAYNGYMANFGPIIDRSGYWAKEHKDDGFVYTAPVSSYLPNGFGLWQMGGNVNEWVQDSFLKGKRQSEWGTDKFEMEDGVYCIAKGGSWSEDPSKMVISSRTYIEKGQPTPFTGFRMAMILVGN